MYYVPVHSIIHEVNQESNFLGDFLFHSSHKEEYYILFKLKYVRRAYKNKKCDQVFLVAYAVAIMMAKTSDGLGSLWNRTPQWFYEYQG